MKTTMRLVLLLSLASSTARAQVPPDDRRPVVISVDPSAAGLGDPAQLQAAIAGELGAPAAAQAEGARGTLTIGVDEARRVVLVYRDAAGNEIHRTIVAPVDPAATVEMLSLIAANLIRNEAEDLLWQAGPPVQAPVAPTAPIPITPVAPPPPLAPVAPPPSLPPLAPPAPVVMELTAVAPARPVADAPNRALAHPNAIGTDGFISSRRGRVYGTGGFYYARALTRHLAVGINNVAGGSDNNDRVALTAGTFLELFAFPRPWLSLYGQGGALFQARFGDGNSTAGGAAPFVAGGLRFWLGEHFSIAASGRVMVVASDSYDTWPETLSQGAVSIAAGLDAGAHF
jgi:hypothetical protein